MSPSNLTARNYVALAAANISPWDAYRQGLLSRQEFEDILEALGEIARIDNQGQGIQGKP